MMARSCAKHARKAFSFATSCGRYLGFRRGFISDAEAMKEHFDEATPGVPPASGHQGQLALGHTPSLLHCLKFASDPVRKNPQDVIALPIKRAPLLPCQAEITAGPYGVAGWQAEEEVSC